MDFSSRVPNIAALLRELGGGSYDKLHRQIRGLMVCSPKRAMAIEVATRGAITKGDLRPDIWLVQGATSPKDAA